MKKKSANIFVFLMISFWLGACASNIQTIEDARSLQQTQTPIITETPPLEATQMSPTLTDQQVADKIAACYQEGSGCGACEPKFNNSVQHVVLTTRMFINAPKDLYPKDIFQYATKINGQASMGWVSNGGLPGEAFAGSPECWSTYVAFNGIGEIELRMPSIVKGVPDYFVRFIVEAIETPEG